jgi:hypothetical protein
MYEGAAYVFEDVGSGLKCVKSRHGDAILGVTYTRKEAVGFARLGQPVLIVNNNVREAVTSE